MADSTFPSPSSRPSLGGGGGRHDHHHLWQLLWEYDPNGLIVVDADLYIKLVNPAFCRMFKVQPDDVIGQPAATILDDVSDFRRVWETGEVYRGKPREFAQHDLLVNQVIFPIPDEGIIACIMADYSHQLTERRELMAIKETTIKQVNQVVDNQMKVVQEIAGLLGETTAQTKVSLLKIVQMLQHEAVDTVAVHPQDLKTRHPRSAELAQGNIPREEGR
ncbi:PAS domain-containing protein [Phormidium sp. FACHB-1136]|uniref:PAS domain-containing protein n=1 Tax=Phormidium sp. FACHB-1136 TaxID=2692848 RepID=UPI001687A0D1|nr:PAS domain-containing protein [Phormidium sp. FACHB-1136]MBD2424789.1 PAS domain-containing protein [Phormidium sp. FACHB-1136]